MADLHWVGAVVMAMVGQFSPVVPEMDLHNLNVAVETILHNLNVAVETIL